MNRAKNEGSRDIAPKQIAGGHHQQQQSGEYAHSTATIETAIAIPRPQFSPAECPINEDGHWRQCGEHDAFLRQAEPATHAHPQCLGLGREDFKSNPIDPESRWLSPSNYCEPCSTKRSAFRQYWDAAGRIEGGSIDSRLRLHK